MMGPNDCLQTPAWVYSAFGKIDMDPCAGLHTSIGAVNLRLEEWDDGLLQPWKGFVFCNPPFSQKEEWISKMKKHGNGVLLLPERGSAPWFGPLAKYCGKYFVLGKKINFIGGPSSNNLGSAIFPFGEEAVKRLENCNLPGHFVEVKFYNNR